MLPFLVTAGLKPHILFEPKQPDETPNLSGVAATATAAGCEVVVLQKVHGPNAVALAQQLAATGIRTVYAVCDLIDVPMVEATDATIVVTEYLKSLYPASLQPRIHVVHDGIEHPDICKSEWGKNHANRARPLRAVLVTSADLDRLPVLGHPPEWMKVRIVGRYARGLRKWRELWWTWSAQPTENRLHYLRFLADRRISCVSWEPVGVYREMMQADIGIIPVETSEDKPAFALPPSWKVKSENRLTMKMSIGLPVIATPIPSYEPVIEHGVNGFFARSKRDWQECLIALRDPARRQEMGMAARASVEKKYSMEEQALKLIRVLS
ncbi:MAG: glycosyltransferase [Gallionellaceae bacterium]